MWLIISIGPNQVRGRLATDGGKKGWRKGGGANREAYAKKFAHLPGPAGLFIWDFDLAVAEVHHHSVQDN